MSFVYVITDVSPEEGPGQKLTNVSVVKIGFTSNDIDNRIAQLQTGNPRKLHLVYLYEFASIEMAKQAERMCHWKLKKHQSTGEWFHYSDEVFSTLKALENLSLFESYTCPDEEMYALLDVHHSARVLRIEVANG
jgi:hypothetical protein